MSGSGGNAGSGCAALSETTSRPVDMFILLDQSASMATSPGRWEPIKNAIKRFAATPVRAGTGVGIGYFGLHPDGPARDPADPGSCDARDYAVPDVPISEMPAAWPLLGDSLDRHAPAGASPTRPALAGALRYARSWAAEHPRRKTIVVLVTDGEPQGCENDDVAAVAGVAAGALLEAPSIDTYVVSVGSVATLTPIAEAGGTRQLFAVAAGNAGPSTTDVLDQIQHAASACDVALPSPEGSMPDYDKVDLLLRAPSGMEGFIPRVANGSGCLPKNHGWYYDRDASGVPIGFKLCPASCLVILATGGSLRIAVGCLPDPPPP